MEKYAIFTIDVESFLDTECLKDKEVNEHLDMFDGLVNYLELLDSYNIKANLFVVADCIDKIKAILTKAINNGHKLSIHGLHHTPALTISNEQFKSEILEAKNILENTFNTKVLGYRAPCFSINQERINSLKEIGLKFSSSFVNTSITYFGQTYNLDNYEKIEKQIYKDNDFYEFEMPKVGPFPIGGGAYFRFLPYSLYMKHKIKKFIKEDSLYIFYLHPFEVSDCKIPKIKNLGSGEKMFLKVGKGKKYLNKVEKTIKLLIKNGYTMTTFEDLIEIIEKK